MTRPTTARAQMRRVSPETELMLADLERSGLSSTDAETLGIVPLDAATAAADVAPGAAGRTAYRLPYFDLNGKEIDFYRLRFTGAPATQLADPAPRYSQPKGSAPRLYLPPLLDRAWATIAADSATPIVITEGEKKAACACKHGFPTIGLGGVWSGIVGGSLLPDFDAFDWKDRLFGIVFDADAATNPQVVNAAARLAAELALRGADPRVGFLPQGGPKGLDDLVVAQGPGALQAVIDAARPLRLGMWPFEMPIPPKLFPHRRPTAKGPGAPLATIENVEVLLRTYGVGASYNVMTKTAVYRGRGFDTSVGAGVQHGAADQALNRIVSQARLCGMAADDLAATVTGMAFSHPENPVRDYLRALPGPRSLEPDPILMLAHRFRVPAEEEVIRDAVFRLWLVQACAAADYAQETPISERKGGPARPTFEYVLTLLGRQGVCKTSTLRGLVPMELRDYFGSGVILNPDNKDSVERATGCWIAELGEIDATFGKGAAASMKAFLSQTTDVYRKPYGRGRNSFPRQTVFAATGNILRSLRDITGSRRFWPVNVLAVSTPTDAEVERAWAKAWALYRAGTQWWPDPKLQRQLDAQVINYAEEFPLGEEVLRVFGPLTPAAKRKRGYELLTAFEILRAIGQNPNPKDPRDVTAARELGNWLARMNVRDDGEPDRGSRAHTSEWRMPRRDGQKGAKYV
jgi:hypothetical protein